MSKIEDVVALVAADLRKQCNVDDVAVATLVVGLPDGRLIPVTWGGDGDPLQQMKILASAMQITIGMLHQALLADGEDPERLANRNRAVEERRLRAKWMKH